MSKEGKSTKSAESIDEDEIFKSLGHKIRRDIIKFVGDGGELTFTEIKNFISPIDSPSLSYHLKSLQPLLINKENKYKLSEIGKAAYHLLLKTDQSQKISKYKKRFIYAYISTVVCWMLLQTVVRIVIVIVSPSNQVPDYYILVVIVMNVMAVINYIFIWKLKEV